MYIFLCILIVIVALLLIGDITILESKGGGLAAGFSSPIPASECNAPRTA